jgi:glycosyltransferase involved in cell wall biosynthesis
MLRSVRAVRDLLRSLSPGAVVSWTFTTHLLAACAAPAGSRLFPSIRGLHYDWATALRRALWRSLIAPRATRVLCVSRAAQEVVCAQAPVARGKTVVLPNGVDTARFAGHHDAASLGLPRGAYLIGTVGRAHPIKGQADLIAALPLVTTEGEAPHLLIAGPASPEQAQALTAQARALGVAERVHLLGPREDVPEVLAALDVFVLPSHSEGMPNALLEAMAAGKPVIATAVGGSIELVTDGVNGLLVPAHSPDSLAAAVSRLRADPALAARLAAAAQEAAATRAWPQVLSQYEALLVSEAGGPVASNPVVTESGEQP